MLSEGLGAVEPVMFAYVPRFCFLGNMRVCGHWAGDWCSPCIAAPRKFFGTVNLATFAVPRSFVAQ